MSKRDGRPAKEGERKTTSTFDAFKGEFINGELVGQVSLFGYGVGFGAADRKGCITQLKIFLEAIHSFERSLRVKPDGSRAMISQRECLLRLGNSAAAEPILEEAESRWPEHREAIRRMRQRFATWASPTT